MTERQLEASAVERPSRDTCVVAGPGSGKTTVLVQYFVNLVESGVDPLRILAITFTEKAANHMRAKLAEAFKDRAEIRGRLERAYVSTVDGFCTRLLKENAIYAGIDPEFRVMDEREALRAQRECVDLALDGLFAEQPERARALMRGLAANDTAEEVLGVYDAIRAAGLSVADLAGFPAPARPEVAGLFAEIGALRRTAWNLDQRAYLREAQEWVARIASAVEEGVVPALRAMHSFPCHLNRFKRGDGAGELFKRLKNEVLPELERALLREHYRAERATLYDVFARFDRLYREKKRQLAALDYADLEEYAVKLLRENDTVRQRVQNQFDQIMMDELQDTNGLQARLLELLRTPDGFYAVGDINQSIYGFRHADPEVFRAYHDAVVKQERRRVELVENFRSREDILRAVAVATDGAEGIVARALVAGKSFAEKEEPSVEVLVAPDAELEAQWIAARMLELEGRLALRSGPAEFRDFAVLVRNSAVMADLARAFDERGIPYLVNQGKGFYESREIVDLMHLLRVIANPRDEIALAVVLRSPFAAVPDEALLALTLHGNLGEAVEQFAAEAYPELAPEDAARIAQFRDRLAGWRAARDSMGIDLLLMRAMEACGYQAATGARGEANIEKFLAQARASGVRQTLAGFVEEIELLRKSQPREPDAPPEDAANAVKIMTVHTAKGLEFPVLFLAGMHKGVDTNPGALSFSPGVGLGANWRLPGGGKDKGDSYHHAVKEEIRRREKEEGHRLLYVAMTRAEEHLVLSFATNGKKPQNWAARLVETMRIDWQPPRDEVVRIALTDGRRLPVRVRSVDGPPAAASAHVSPADAPAAEVLQAPAAGGLYDSQATITSLALFADCPRSYYLSRYLGFETSPRPAAATAGGGPSATDFGGQAHALLAGLPVAQPHPEVVRLVEGFRKSVLGKRAAAASIVEREFDFLMEVENMVLRGQIDLWFEDGGKLVLVDYKTDREQDPARYTLQLRLYALALERLTGRAPDEAYLCYLRTNTAVPVDLRPTLFDSPEAVVREFREAQERQHFPLREGERCRTCPHSGGLCPAAIPGQGAENAARPEKPSDRFSDAELLPFL